MPVWDMLIPVLLGLILLDVATRRIAWDWQSTKRMAAAAAGKVREFTTTRKVESAPLRTWHIPEACVLTFPIELEEQHLGRPSQYPSMREWEERYSASTTLGSKILGVPFK